MEKIEFVTKSAFTKRVANIKKDATKLRDNVQQGLIEATYLCIANSGGTTPLQQILDSVGNAAHRQGITTWMETFAPVRMEKEKVLLNKTAWELLDRDDAMNDFKQFIVDSQMDEPQNKWFVIAKKSNSTVSIFNLDVSFDAFIKKLEKNDLSGLGKALRDAEQAWKESASTVTA